MLTLGERLVAVIAAHRHILSIVPLFLLCSTSMAGQQAERERLDDANEQYRHQRREVEAAERGEAPAERPHDRIGRPIQQPRHGRERADAGEPAQERARDDGERQRLGDD
jgi:hypothetical protein